MAMNHPKKCIECRNHFYAKNIRAVYCSTNCRVKANRRKSVKNVTQNPNEKLSPDEFELKGLQEVLQKEESELIELYKKKEEHDIVENAKIERNESLRKEKSALLEKQKRLKSILNSNTQNRNTLANHGNNISEKILGAIAGNLIDRAFENPKLKQQQILELKTCENRIKEIDKELNVFIPSYFISFKIEVKNTWIEEQKIKCKQLEESIAKSKAIKALSLMKDENGFVKAKDVQNINFADRINLSGDLGVFLGQIERDKCAITLSGEPGSGKTYLCFDLMSKFVKANFKVCYFSLEEGITQLTQMKLERYNLLNAVNLEISESANIDDVKRFSNKFDVIIIDSWGKLNADIVEFDKLRINYPKTIFISIFQQTSSGQMRGGTRAAFDAGINIETSKSGEKRFAVCTKNRYGNTGVKYFIDDFELEK
jgi:archaellum biogenesis ATPase FlaH